ncbi:hypothetical protein KM043_001815 [Ampulex compressa]|nr:hypothetical protein KM043_001815 [Ampulex compressa]
MTESRWRVQPPVGDGEAYAKGFKVLEDEVLISRGLLDGVESIGQQLGPVAVQLLAFSSQFRAARGKVGRRGHSDESRAFNRRFQGNINYAGDFPADSGSPRRKKTELEKASGPVFFHFSAASGASNAACNPVDVWPASRESGPFNLLPRARLSAGYKA